MEESGDIDVLVYGSAIVDFICYVERLPKPGETLHGTQFANGYGGKGANQCVAAARLGAKCAMVARVGADTWGDNYIKQLESEGVNIKHVKKCVGQNTGIAQIAVSNDGENHIIIVAGANNCLNEKDVRESCDLFENAKILLCQLETPVNGTLEALKGFKGVSILNAAPAIASLPYGMLQWATILCVNETEAAVMTNSEEIKTLEHGKDALKKLLDMGSKLPIITLGAQGVVYAEKAELNRSFYYVPAEKVDDVVDTTGAGDAFLGALAFHIAKFPSKPMHQHIGFANLQASISVQIPGTQTSFPNAFMSEKDEENDYLFKEI